MFWIENTGTDSIVLFSFFPMEEYTEELAELGGLRVEQVTCIKESSEREGWIFEKKLRAVVESFIERETSDIQSADEDDITLDDMKALLLEINDRLCAVEKRIFSKR
jgi:hypothetical protein